MVFIAEASLKYHLVFAALLHPNTMRRGGSLTYSPGCLEAAVVVAEPSGHRRQAHVGWVVLGVFRLLKIRHAIRHVGRFQHRCMPLARSCFVATELCLQGAACSVFLPFFGTKRRSSLGHGSCKSCARQDVIAGAINGVLTLHVVQVGGVQDLLHFSLDTVQQSDVDLAHVPSLICGANRQRLHQFEKLLGTASCSASRRFEI
mmetsp:Transcript_38428/g.96444  ORF Transcript_38428/g.96444 Transcript_38428/m.96444 type:complete len:203 (-) Transcript_38428:12-620(-)